MLIDARSLEDDGRVDVDVCVIGSGPAGLAVAGEISRVGARVGVFESGGDRRTPEIQRLAAAEQSGDALEPPHDTRERRLGGNVTRWYIRLATGETGLRLVPLDAVDFEPRGDPIRPGWPITRTDLDPWYVRALHWFGATDVGLVPSAGLVPWPADEPWRVDERVLRTARFTFGRSRTVLGHLDELVGSTRAIVATHATATELVLADGGTAVDHVRFRHLDGRTFTVGARHVVLALGGIGNARLLLQSTCAPGGIGNTHDLVGRYFMDHPLIPGGHLVPSDRGLVDRSRFYDLVAHDGWNSMGFISLADAVLRERAMSQLSAVFFPRPTPRRVRAAVALRESAVAAREHRLITALQSARHVAAGLDYVGAAALRRVRVGTPLLAGFGRGGWSLDPHPSRYLTGFEVTHQAEQLPDPDNRVTLSSHRDALGMPVPHVHWSWTRRDRENLAASRALMASELARAGIGRVIVGGDGAPEDRPSGGTAHHIGTTRMSADPRRGVVDEHCRVHGIANLFVAGSSVFPTGGFANPTLTIGALGLRLGDHISGQLGASD